MRQYLDNTLFIERANIRHNNFYDYSKFIYTGDSVKGIIICPLHGEFEQRPGVHVRQGHGCPKCKAIKTSQRCLDKGYFINKLNKVRGNNYILLGEYNGIHTTSKFKCIIHNIEFETQCSTTLRKHIHPCPKCSIGNNKYIKNRIKRGESFIHKSKHIHGDKYNYSKVEYVNIMKRVSIICPIHGMFLQTPSDHLYGKCGCPVCSMPHGESRIAIYLKENHIENEYQYKVKLGESNHYFDFYLPKQNIIISFNGLQHYKPIKYFGGIKSFKVLQERDQIKNKYCVDNNIKHIIIDYKDIDKIENILDKHIKL